MKVIILAGGLGTRLSEETIKIPKPMVEIGGVPILLHIMNIYASYGFTDFVIACGYKGEMIKAYFQNYFLHNSNFIIHLKDGRHEVLDTQTPDWRVSVIDTGFNTMTGGRLRRLKKWINQERFMLTYGDGVADVNLKSLLAFHLKHGKPATVTAVRPPARFGGLVILENKVLEFSEKPQTGEGWINGGFFVFEPDVLDYIEDDQTILEREPLEKLAAQGQLMAFHHEGFWQPMDTLREKSLLESLWAEGKAPWKVW